jgi:ABC transporter substrate binding protein
MGRLTPRQMAAGSPESESKPVGALFCLTPRKYQSGEKEERYFVAAGGLISYGPDYLEIYRQPGYVDRILRGKKPTDLPVQAPTKYELVINLKTAKTLGIEIPTSIGRPVRFRSTDTGRLRPHG